MKVMVMVKASADSEAGVMPSEQLIAEMEKFNEVLAKAGILLVGRRAETQLEGRAGPILGRGPHRDRRALRRDEGTGRGLLALAGEVDGGGDRVGQALPEPDAGRIRDRDSPRLRPGGFRTVAIPTGELRAAEQRLRAEAEARAKA